MERWYSEEVHNPYELSLWKYIWSGWVKFSKFLRFDVGGDTCIHFWYDLWCGDSLLKDATYPELFWIAHNI